MSYRLKISFAVFLASGLTAVFLWHVAIEWARQLENANLAEQQRLYGEQCALLAAPMVEAGAIQGFAARTRRTGGWLLLPALGLLGIFSFLTGTALTARLRELHRVADRMAEDGPGLTVPIRGGDEVSRVARSLNDLSERLAVTYRQIHETAERYQDLSNRLEEREKMQSAMLGAALDAVITIDENGDVIEFNKAAEQTFGFKREEAIGREMAELIVPKDFRNAHRQGMRHLKKTGEGPVLGQRLEIQAQNRDGKLFPIELAITQLDIEGRHLYTGFIRDITDRRQAEAELRLAASTFETQEGIFITDNESRIVRVNRAFENLTGYDQSLAEGMDPTRFLIPAETEEEPAVTWKELLSGETRSANMQVRRRNGDVYPVWLGLTAVCDDEGALTHHVAHFIDMTERRQFEQELRSARIEAESSNRAKSQFLANMSHEIRTPLNAIINLNELLLDSDLEENQRELASAASKGGRALASLVGSVLDLTQIESGKMSIATHPFDPAAMVDELRALFGPQADSAGLKLEFEIGTGIPARLAGDDLRLRQVLVNLIGNALKFTESGSVQLTVRPAQNGYLRFEVSDTGIGISAEFADRVFEEFAQADARFSRRYGGSGLGLAISQRLVKMMGGEIGYRPGERVGSVFWFTVPLIPASPTEQPELPSDGPTTEVSGHVLLAEDSLANQLVARTIIENAGCTVHLANDGAEAIEMAANERFDLIFMDISMPGTDGLEAARRIRALEGNPSTVPIVAMTANVFAEDRERCLQAGMDDFITKPISAQSLRDRLVYWLDRDVSANGDGEKLEQVGRHGNPQRVIMNRRVLDEMARETSPEVLAEIVGIFISETEERLGQLGGLSAADEPKQLSLAAHAIKSSAAIFGAERLYDAAKAVEASARNGDAAAAAAGIGAVLTCGDETLAAYSEHFGCPIAARSRRD